jgi:hypothetical protein
VKQLTLRGLDKELERKLRETARASGVSLNRAALDLMRRGAGVCASSSKPNTVGDSLDHLIGTWSAADERRLLAALEPFEQVDESLWR